MLNHGVEKVIWIFTATSKVMVAENGNPWTIDNWSEDVEVIEQITMNIEKLLADF